MENLLILSNILTPIVTFLAGFKLQKINLKKETADFNSKIQEVYTRFVEDTNQKLIDYEKRIEQKTKEFDELLKKCKQCER